MPLKFTIVTPSYNQGPFIERTLLSVLTQESDSEIEYLVMDGGSGDETVDVLKRYEGRIRWVSERDDGQAHAVNKGWAQAAGDIFGWLNSDDIYYPRAFETVAAVFSAHPEIEVIYGKAHHIDKSDAVIEPYPTEPWDYQRLIDTCYLCQPAVFIRRRVVERHGPLDVGLRYAMDYEYWIRLARAGVPFFYIEDVLAGSRLYAENKTLGSSIRVHAEINDVLRKHLKRVPDRWLFNYAHALVRSRGYGEDNRPTFILAVSAFSLGAALRWNRCVSLEMTATTWNWVKSAMSEWWRSREKCRK